jgi:hypothetical protein
MKLTYNDFLEGDKVYFGRENGQRTLGIIHKKNPKRAKVKLLEKRGHGFGSEIGSVWNVAYGAMEHAEDTFVMKVGGVEQRLDVRQPEPLKYHPFDEDNGILMEILNCYNGLSPECLTCDGEASASRIRQQSAKLNRKLKYLQLAIDKQISEEQAYQWIRSKDEYDRGRKDDRIKAIKEFGIVS